MESVEHDNRDLKVSDLQTMAEWQSTRLTNQRFLYVAKKKNRGLSPRPPKFLIRPKEKKDLLKQKYLLDFEVFANARLLSNMTMQMPFLFVR